MKFNSTLLAGALTAATLNQGCLHGPKMVDYDAAAPRYVMLDYPAVDMDELRKNLDDYTDLAKKERSNVKNTTDLPAELARLKIQATCQLVKLNIADKVGLQVSLKEEDGNGETQLFGAKEICQLLDQYQQDRLQLKELAKARGLSLRAGSRNWSPETGWISEANEPTPLEEQGYFLLIGYDKAIELFNKLLERGEKLNVIDKVKLEANIVNQKTVFETMLKYKLGSK